MKELDGLRAALKGMTPGPLAWGFLRRDDNGYIIGAGVAVDGKPVSGFVRTSDITDEFLCKSLIGEYEAATCNYKDPEAIVLAVNLAAHLAAVAEAAERMSMECARGALPPSLGAVERLDSALAALKAAAASKEGA